MSNPNLHEISNDYIENMISNIKEMKAIVMDKETQIIFSLEFSKSLALKQEIFLFENIEKIQPSQKFNLSGIFFLRPTSQNLNYLKEILKNLNFKEIHLFFSNTVPDDYLQKIAQYDINMQVKSFQEVYFDYYVINSNVFHLNIESCISNLAMSSIEKWNDYDSQMFDRIWQGLISICLSNRVFPVIKCVKGSKISSMLSKKIAEFFNENYTFIRKECGSNQNGLLFIFDRKEDPVTPLINQWTYQAQIHELIGIKNNVVQLKGEKNNQNEKLVVSDVESIDKFFATHMNSDYGNFTVEANAAAEKLKKESNENSGKENTIEEIRKLIETLPEKRKESMNITKHLKLTYEIIDYVTKYKLMDLSPLEQEIAVHDDRKGQYNQIIKILSDDKIKPLDKAKLYLLYIFRYEGDSMINNLKDAMRENKMGDWIVYGDLLLKYAGKNKRTLDCLENKDFMAKGKKFFMNAFKGGSTNAFMQHISYLQNIVEGIIKNKNKENDYETYLSGNAPRPNKIIVFCFGGITFEETKDLTNLSHQLNIPIICGGTDIINSKGFFTELSMLKQKSDLNDDIMLNVN